MHIKEVHNGAHESVYFFTPILFGMCNSYLSSVLHRIPLLSKCSIICGLICD